MFAMIDIKSALYVLRDSLIFIVLTGALLGGVYWLEQQIGDEGIVLLAIFLFFAIVIGSAIVGLVKESYQDYKKKFTNKTG